MHATNPDDGSIDAETVPLIEPAPGEANLDAFLANVNRLEGVHAEPHPEAFACTSNNCRLDEYLAQIHIDGFGTRALCPIHVLDLLDREVGLER